jgi:hypothetical protein
MRKKKRGTDGMFVLKGSGDFPHVTLMSREKNEERAVGRIAHLDDASLIVLCVNAHVPLVRVLEGLEMDLESGFIAQNSARGHRNINRRLDEIRYALIKARG